MKGIVKTWLDGRGFGFIDSEESPNDVFVHYSALSGTFALHRGQRVEFDVADTNKGPRAVEVTVMDDHSI